MGTDFSRAKISADRIEIRHADGTRETLKDGIYRLKAKRGEDVRRIATEDDVAHLLEVGATADFQTRLLADGSVWKLTPRSIQVSWPDGSEETVKGDVYEHVDAEGVETERPATLDDIARLEGLGEGELGAKGGDDEDEGPEVERGGRRDDDMKGDDADDAFAGGAGDDRMRGGGGNDDLSGGSGRDELRGGDGDDALSGGDDDDRLRGDAGADSLSGGAGRDRLDGGDDGDLLSGDAGDDRLDGGKGDDLLYGGEGDDRIKGGQGDDVIEGGAGDDRLWGQEGADRFVFAAGDGHDRIHGFDAGEDVLDLTAFAFSDAAAALATAAQDGDDVLLSLAPDCTVRLDETDLADLSEAALLI
ncbi:calcium-binding protein [Albimonas sp. CAU 1670]|uniref:calcium-binding protein n=1 Tax=Albimonas sp. CAU 1670 TaxID=3032599 RepID=UPI0023DBB696|nr:calcium-binding protein [Albimonas sp. CAU 1670]MDF2233864.1 calcium-binding protein [Albimonas sp. CAU 1670]